MVVTDSGNFPAGYEVPKVWKPPQQEEKGKSLDRYEAGPTHEKDLPVGAHKFQLYSMATPNGAKVAIMFEELLELGISEAEYDAWLIDIYNGDQFGSGFVSINPNAKIPALVEYSNGHDQKASEPLKIFESGNILLYLAEKFEKFIPSRDKSSSSAMDRVKCLNWLFWQIGSAPQVGTGFVHFLFKAPTKIEYAINRYTMETKRQLDILNRHLAENRYMIGGEYTIADIAIFPWYGEAALGNVYPAARDFLDIRNETYPHLIRWAKEVFARPAVRRGRMVNKYWGPPEGQLVERHDESDFEPKKQKSSYHSQEGKGTE